MSDPLKKPPRQTKEQKKSVELSFDTCLLGQSDHKKHILIDHTVSEMRVCENYKIWTTHGLERK